jgi:hypothetical protein
MPTAPCGVGSLSSVADEIVPAGGHQSCRQRGRPFLVGLLEGQAGVADYLPEGLAVIDGGKELPPRLDG